MVTSSRVPVFRRLASLWPLAMLAVVWALNAAVTPDFARLGIRDGRLYGSMIDVVHRGAPVALLAVGMTLVIASGGIDLSVGSVMAIAGAVAARAIVAGDPSLVVVIVAGLLVAAAAGVWNGLLVAWLGLQPIVATLILLVAGRGVAQLITDGQIIVFERPGFEFLGTGALLGLPFTVWLAAGVAVVVGAALRATSFGLYLEAVGGNERAARLSGLPVGRVKLLAYTVCGLCAGLAGLTATADIKAADVNNCGLYLELDAILAVVLGGTSLSGGRARLLGSLAGALLMQTLTTTMLMRGIGPPYALVVKAVAAVAVCCLYSRPLRERLAGARRRWGVRFKGSVS